MNNQFNPEELQNIFVLLNRCSISGSEAMGVVKLLEKIKFFLQNSQIPVIEKKAEDQAVVAEGKK